MRPPIDYEDWLADFRVRAVTLEARQRAARRATAPTAVVEAPAAPPPPPGPVEPRWDPRELWPPEPWDVPAPARATAPPGPQPQTPRLVQAGEARHHLRGRRRPSDPGRGGRWESLALFLVAFGVYALLGHRLVLEQHIVPFDALGRVAHAYLAWYDEPAKLTAIGFVWPPLQTLALLPFTLSRGIATSLFALPLSTAFFAAVALTTVARTLRVLDVGPGWRLALVAAFALNPLFVFYATNGMSEMLTIACLALFMHCVTRWLLGRSAGWLLPAGVVAGLLVLTRYETLAYVAVAALGVGLLLRRRHASAIEAEGTLVAFLAPTVYTLGLWTLLNALLIGDPLNWLTRAGGQSVGEAPANGSPPALLGEVLALNVRISLLVPLALVGLLVLAVRRRSGRAGMLVALLLTNVATTMLLFAREAGTELLQPRYNMRVLPIALIGIAWVAWELGRGPRRTAWLAGALAAAVLALPVAWQLMESYPRQYQEQAFTRAIATGEDQAGSVSRSGFPIGVESERRMATFIREEIRGEHVVLTDDSLTLGVILLSDVPGRFFDRIQQGDAAWKRALAQPFGSAEYLLITTDEGCRPQPPFCDDLIRERYPELLAGRARWVEPVLRTPTNVLLRITGPPPRR